GPVTLDAVNRMLVGQAPAEAAFEAAAAEVERQLDPPGDIHASAAYRRRLARVLTLRALRVAAERALRPMGAA
ncbi:MAG TPA: hypothetical protein VFO95_06265, partial [Gemmatimonadales bacterium]|nr:hypothetical protein [Gemmatimonadales bacterium]